MVIKVQPGRLYRESNERGVVTFWSHILVQEWDFAICYLPSNCEDIRSKTGDMSHAMILSLSQEVKIAIKQVQCKVSSTLHLVPQYKLREGEQFSYPRMHNRSQRLKL